MSGFGNKTILSSVGISTVVNLPGVGENLQLLAQFDQGAGLLTQFVYVASYSPPSVFLNTIDLAKAQSLLVAPSTGIALSPAQLALTLQYFEAGVPFVEFIPGDLHILFLEGTSQALRYYATRDSTTEVFFTPPKHATSSNPLTASAINPNYLQSEFDTFILSKSLQFARKLGTSSALSPFLVGEVTPGPSVQTEAEWEAYVRSSVGTEYHPIGTASMLPRASGGVVDAHLLVYGTTNVRVADLSVLPLHISSHPQSLAYAIAEKAATIISALF